MKAIRNLTQVFLDDNVIITKVYDGGTIVRIDARTKNHIPDKDNYFSRWYSIKYANELSMQFRNKKITELCKTKYCAKNANGLI